MSAATQNINYSIDHSLFQSDINSSLNILNDAISAACRPIASTKFSADSAVFLHMLTRILPDIPIIWVDTGYNTRDTLKFASYLESSLKLNLKVYRPVEQRMTIPPTVGTSAHTTFTHATKLAPFQLAINELEPDLWLSSLRRYQSSHRSMLAAREVINPKLAKLYPMLEWSVGTVDFYRKNNALPTGPAAYDPTKGQPLRECGLHTKLWCASDAIKTSFD